MPIKISFLFLCCALPLVLAELKVGFYDSTCSQAESIIQEVVQNRFKADPSITPALLRMHFHDCFVRGCDASILRKQSSEKKAAPNLTVRGFEIIDEAKRILEAACPSIVSCADIITIATRDSVALAGGPNYTVPTGRRDGLVSNSAEVNLPSPSFSVPQSLQAFTAKGMSLDDMVTLLGAHTVGVAHCSSFQDRLSTTSSPSMDSNLAANLISVCGAKSRRLRQEPTAFLDQNTSFVFDNEFYHQINLNKGILQIDQDLALDKSTGPLVSSFVANGGFFQQSFGDAMVKLGSVEVLVGNSGEIRKNCRVFNQKKRGRFH